MKHSQRLNETPLHCWIITQDNGEVCCGHCTCMAGLGETCTHVAAILFYLEASNRVIGIETCTQRKCEWIIPSSVKNIEYLPLSDIDFSSAQTKKRRLDANINDQIPTTVANESHDSNREGLSMSFPSSSIMSAFYTKLSMTSTMPAVLSLIPEHSERYVPKCSLPEYPKPLKSLHQSQYMTM